MSDGFARDAATRAYYEQRAAESTPAAEDKIAETV